MENILRILYILIRDRLLFLLDIFFPSYSCSSSFAFSFFFSYVDFLTEFIILLSFFKVFVWGLNYVFSGKGHVSESEAEVDEEYVKSESVELEAEMNKDTVPGGVFAPESLILDEILSVESVGSISMLHRTGDSGGPEQKEVGITCSVVCSPYLSIVFENDCFYVQVWAVREGGEEISEHFHQLVPDMAIEFPFELDKFQKEVLVVA